MMENNKDMRDGLLLVASMWIVRLCDTILPLDFNEYGLVPRTLSGMVGIVTMPFLHSGWGHLIGNTIPLCILLFMLMTSRRNSWDAIGSIVLLGGILLWCFGRSAIHVGASGLVYGLVALLITIGILERNFVSIAVSLLVGFLYGTTLISGVLPTIGSSVSWDGHLCGAIAGVATAYIIHKFDSTKAKSNFPEST
jgi:membrane associated rhomboid family serine protease